MAGPLSRLRGVPRPARRSRARKALSAPKRRPGVAQRADGQDHGGHARRASAGAHDRERVGRHVDGRVRRAPPVLGAAGGASPDADPRVLRSNAARPGAPVAREGVDRLDASRGAGGVLRLRLLHSRLAQLFSDAVHDGLWPSRRALVAPAPPRGKARAYVATTEQVWALHDAMPENLRPVITLSAFAGLRLGEVCGLRVSDVDFMRGIVSPRCSTRPRRSRPRSRRTSIPIPQEPGPGALGLRRNGRGEHLVVS
jgi:integrase